MLTDPQPPKLDWWPKNFNPCAHGHVFVWSSGRFEADPPLNLPCCCGQTRWLGYYTLIEEPDANQP
jgi:hypothetical protein